MDHNPRVFSLWMWEHLRKILSAHSSDFLSCSDSGFHGVNLAIAARKTSRTAPPMQRFLISWGKLGNRCRECPGLALLRAVIHDFRGSIWESLQENPLNSPTAAAILDFRPKLGNHCKFSPVFTLFRASILDFKAKLGNHCRECPGLALLRAAILLPVIGLTAAISISASGLCFDCAGC